MNEQLEHLIDRTLAQIEAAIAHHNAGEIEPLPSALLQSISKDIRQVRAEWPLRAAGYGRFIIDWPDDSEIRSDLIDVAYQMERARQKESTRKA